MTTYTEIRLTALARRLDLGGTVESAPFAGNNGRMEHAYVLQTWQGSCRSGCTRLGASGKAAAAALREMAARRDAARS